MPFRIRTGRSKFGNVPTMIGGERFASKKEAARWEELLILQQAGVITDLKRQVRIPIVVNGVKVCEYIADATYHEGGEYVVEDVKSEFTRRDRVYRLKRKLMQAANNITIHEV